MKKYVYIYYTMNKVNRIVFASILLLALDFIYINMIKTQYEAQIVRIQRVVMKVKILPVIVCYALLIFALYYFILRTHRPILDAFLLGFIIYGVFDATNYALFKKWDLRLAIADALWGGTLFALTTFLIYSF